MVAKMSDPFLKMQRQIQAIQDTLERLRKADVPTATPASATTLLVRAHTSADVTINSSSIKIINFDTVDYDPGSDVTTGASWHYTVPTTGWYRIGLENGYVYPNGSAWVTDNSVQMDVAVNTSFVETLDYDSMETNASTDHWPFLNGDVTIHLTAGDSVDLEFSNGSTAARLLGAGSVVTIDQVA